MKIKTDNNHPREQMPSEPTSNNGASAEPHPLNNVVSRVSMGSMLAMQTGLFNLGRNRARQSGTTEPQPDDICSLEAHARAMARETYRDRFDPEQNVHDRMTESEYQKLLTDRKAADVALQYASVNLHYAEDNLARSPKAAAKRAVHPLLL